MATLINVRTGGMVVLTDGVAGAVGCDGSRVLRARGPGVRGAYPVGSGDAFLGGMVAALDQGADLADGLVLGMACGTANALVPGTRPPRPRHRVRAGPRRSPSTPSNPSQVPHVCMGNLLSP